MGPHRVLKNRKSLKAAVIGFIALSLLFSERSIGSSLDSLSSISCEGALQESFMRATEYMKRHREQIIRRGYHLPIRFSDGIPGDVVREITLPYILHHGGRTKKVALLVHGLSDSPHSLRGIGEVLYEQGYNVVSILLSGHGSDYTHLKDVLVRDWYLDVALGYNLAEDLGEEVTLVGYSLGGGLVAEFAGRRRDLKVKDIMLFAPLLDQYNPRHKWITRTMAKLFDRDVVKSTGGTDYTYPIILDNAAAESNAMIRRLHRYDAELYDRYRFLSVTTPSDTVVSNEYLDEFLEGHDVTSLSIDGSVPHADVPLPIMKNGTMNPEFDRIRDQVIFFVND